MEVTAAVPPRRFNRKQVLEALLEHPPEWVSSIKDQYDGDWTLLLDNIVAKLPRKPKRSPMDMLLGRSLPADDGVPLPQHIHFGAALIHAGRREGVNVVLAALTGSDRALRSLALNAIQDMRAENLGCSGQPGAMPLSSEELSSALGIGLKDMFHAEANEAMELFSQREPREYLPVLTPLLWHEDPHVFRPVIQHFVEIDSDDGALDVIAQHLLEPGIRTAKELMTQSRTTHDLCEYLALWTDPSKAEPHRQRAAQIASDAIIEALDSENPHERLAFAPKGWLSPEELFNAVCQCPSDTTAGLLERVAFSSSLEARTRAEALLQLNTMTGITLAVRQTVIHGFFARDTGAVSSNSKFIENLVAYDLVTMDELARGAANPKWTFDVTEAITKWLGGDNTQNDAAVAVKGLLVALATLSEKFSYDTRSEIRYVAECLATLPRSPEDNASIRQSLNAALVGAQRMTDDSWIAQEVMTLLQEFGGGAELDLDTMNPWDAMREHWRRENINWQHAVQLLVDAGAINPERQFMLPQAAGDTGRNIEIPGQLESVLLDGGRACFERLNSISYDHHHDKLFSAFVALSHQPLTLETVVQLGEMQFAMVPDEEQPQEAKEYDIPVVTTEGTRMQVVVSFQGQTFKFYAYPNGTYMDAWAVFHAFNQFMARLERPERLFWLGSEQEGEDSGRFVCALPEKFLAACEELRLPVRRPT
jgi:hypothetical protein